jgi:hypothetical protein
MMRLGSTSSLSLAPPTPVVDDEDDDEEEENDGVEGKVEDDDNETSPKDFFWGELSISTDAGSFLNTGLFLPVIALSASRGGGR